MVIRFAIMLSRSRASILQKKSGPLDPLSKQYVVLLEYEHPRSSVVEPGREVYSVPVNGYYDGLIALALQPGRHCKIDRVDSRFHQNRTGRGNYRLVADPDRDRIRRDIFRDAG